MPSAYLHAEDGELVPVDVFWSDGTDTTLVNTIINQTGPSGPPPPNGLWPPQSGQILGVYDGNPSETPDGGKSWLGINPQISSSYYGYNNRITTSNQTAMNGEAARLSRGSWVLLTQKAGIDGQGSANTNPPYLMSSALDNETAAVAWWDQYLAALKQLSEVDQRMIVMATVQHEYVNNVENGNVSGPDATADVYGAFLGWLANRALTKAPLAKIGVWFNAKHGGGQQSTLTERLVLAAIPTEQPVSWIGADFYTTSNHSDPNETLDDVWSGSTDFGWITGSADYARLGSPPLVAPEFGCSKFYSGTLSRTDAQIAAYYNATRSAMVSNNVCVAVMFNRDSGPQGRYKIDTGSYPLAVAALAGQIAASA